MRYNGSIHYREDPREEVDSALTANSMESVLHTLEGRLLNEKSYRPRDVDEIERVEKQLSYLGILATKVEVIV